ncbi:IS1 transposase [Serratia quinivorans]|nr:IS1 transposase [Serratia quinivorans]CAI1719858.1 IS1 transposase [Serratia quinivorans]
MSGAKAISDGYFMLTIASESESLHMHLCPRNALTLKRLLVLLSQFKIAFWMTDAWPVYRTRLASTSHVVSKKYTQRIERHNLNLRTHLKRLARKTICFSKSEEMHDKIIGWYLAINHYH